MDYPIRIIDPAKLFRQMMCLRCPVLYAYNYQHFVKSSVVVVFALSFVGKCMDRVIRWRQHKARNMVWKALISLQVELEASKYGINLRIL